MPVGHEDHGGVAVAPAVAAYNFHEPFDFRVGQIFPSAQVGVVGPFGANCSVYGGREASLRRRSAMEITPRWQKLFE